MFDVVFNIREKFEEFVREWCEVVGASLQLAHSKFKTILVKIVPMGVRNRERRCRQQTISN